MKYIIAGSITKFATEKRGGGVRRARHRRSAAPKAKSEVALTARIIDATTGEILVSAKGLGESNKGGGFDFAKGGFGVGTNAEEWRNSALGEAQEKACNEFVTPLIAKKDRLE